MRVLKRKKVVAQINPNIRIVGGKLDINGSDVSGFTQPTYIVIPKGLRNTNNVTIVMCFTTSSDITSYQTVFISEFYCAYDIQNGSFQTYNYGTKENQLYTLNPNTKYWIKCIISGTSKIYYVSLDGIAYTQIITDNDEGMIFDKEDIPPAIGHHNGNLIDRPFTGIIHLSECYIMNDDTIVWRGASNIEKTFNYMLTRKKLERKINSDIIILGCLDIDENYNVTGFSSNNYMIVRNNVVKSTNAEYGGKFTTGVLSTQPERPLHIQKLLAIELNSSKQLKLYSWSSETSSDGIDLLDDTTYWFKAVISGNTKTLYLSTDGINFNQSVSIEDTAMSTTETWAMAIGASSYDSSGAWGGYIHLADYYIKVGGVTIWSGVDETNINKSYMIGN